MYTVASLTRPLRIMTKYPNNNWTRIWQNFHTAWIPDTVRSTWYMVIHDILPTKERLKRIAKVDSDLCNQCGQTDTIHHRIIECETGRDMWRWTQARIAAILRMNTCCVSDDWPFRPQFNLWPPQRHSAVVWILAFFVYFRVQHPDQPNLLNYADFMRRARWKAHSLPQRRMKVGNYLTVL